MWNKHLVSYAGNYFLYFFIIILPWVIYYNVLKGWWRWDDPMLLNYIISNNLWEPLLVPKVWQDLTPYNFTPLVFISLAVDYYFFGLEPVFYYGHQLVMLSGIMILTYFFLHRWCSRLLSIFGVVLFCVGPVVMTTANQLMTRHYIEGLFFFILAMILYLKSLEKQRPVLAFLGALAYFAAMSAKEIYFPLIFFVMIWPGNINIRQRVKNAIFYIMSFGIFLVWRTYMLGGSMDGYGINFSLILNHIGMPVAIAKALFGNSIPAILFWSMTGLIIIYASIRHKRILLLFVSIVCLMSPLIVVAPIISGPDRFFIFIWWALSVSAVVAFAKCSWHKPIAIVLKSFLALTLLTTTVSYAQSQKMLMEQKITLFEDIGKFIWYLNDSEGILYTPVLASNDWYMVGLIRIKEQVLPQVQGPKAVFADPVELFELNGCINDRIWVYDSELKRIENDEQKLNEIISIWNRRKEIKELDVSISYDKKILVWNFGPYKEGVFRAIYRGKENVTGSSVLSGSGKLRIILHNDLVLRIRYDSPEGWITYSPWFTINPEVTNDILWNRDNN